MITLLSPINWSLLFDYFFGGWMFLITIPALIFIILTFIALMKEAIKDDGGLPWLPF